MKTLTAKQKAFVVAKAQGMGNSAAAEVAGFAYPAQEAVRLMKSPEVRQALWEEREALIARRLAPKALAALEGILDDSECQAAARVRAAVWLLEASGHGLEAEKARRGLIPLENRSLLEMSETELAEFIQMGRAKLKEMEAAMAIEVQAEEQPGDQTP